MIKILDASALLTYLEKEPGYEKVRDAFIKAANTGKNLSMTTVNWGEVLYILTKELGQEEADKIEKVIESFPIELVPVDTALAKQAAYYKAEYKLPYVDCFAAGLSKLRRGELLTCDNDFRIMKTEIKILWLN
ncbi:MAG: type II toxin-antitoxin system VapC family toxin [Planctomycetota bacterium]